jgi:hypothetical protein
MQPINISNSIKSIFYKMIFQLKKHSPEILTGVGITGVVAGTVLACVATTKLEKTVSKHKEEIDAVHDEREEMSEQEYRKELAGAYGRAAWSMVKLYGPAAVVEATSIGCLIGSHKILRDRNAAIAAAYTTLSTAFDHYKKRVAEKLGDDAEKEIRYNVHDEEIEEEYEDKKGKKKTQKAIVKVVDDDDHSPYSRFYDAGCSGWSRDAGANNIYLKNVQAYFNDRLQLRGYVFLNEVYEYLNLPPIQEGQYIGWYYDPNDETLHNKIDFGIYDIHNKLKRSFVNGFEPVIILDFNIDGNIVDRFGVNNEKAKINYQNRDC